MLTTKLAATRLEAQTRRAAHDLESVLRLLGAAVRHLDDAEPGYPGGGSGGGYSADDGPLRQSVIVRDDALRDRRQLEQLCGELEANARTLLAVVHRWGFTRHGSTEGVDERSIVCESCGHNDRPKDRRRCDWCTRTLKAVNDIRGGLGRQPLTRLPVAAIDHVRNGRMRRVTPADLDRWARDGGKR